MNLAAELRHAFDRSFAQVPSPGAATLQGFLTIRLGGNPYALRVAEISGLFAAKRITRLPSPVSELIGIATVRGTVFPVYDLSMLLDYPPAHAPRWLLAAAAAPVGLAFEDFECYLAAQPKAVARGAAHHGAWDRHVREVLHTEIAQPVIHLLSVLETIKSLGDHSRRT